MKKLLYLIAIITIIYVIPVSIHANGITTSAGSGIVSSPSGTGIGSSSDTEMLFNNAGVVDGIPELTYDGLDITLTSIFNGFRLLLNSPTDQANYSIVIQPEAADKGIFIYESDAQDRVAIKITAGSSGGNVSVFQTDALQHELSLTNAFFALLGNNVGIGTNSASSKLHVDSNGIDTVAIVTLENTARNIQYFLGSGSPEGVQTGSIGDEYTDTVGGAKYIKNTGTATNTGWLELSPSSVNLAEMTIHENATALTIDTADKEHAVRLFSAGDLDNWTFDAGSTGAITDTANNGGILRITDVGHGLVTGDIVTITGLTTAAQNDVTAITRIDDDTFDCDDIVFVTASETGTWNQGSHLIAGTGSLGRYIFHIGTSATSASANNTFEWHIYINTTRVDDIGLRRKFTSTDVGVSSGSAIATIANGDKVWLSIQNIGGTANMTHIHANINLHRL